MTPSFIPVVLACSLCVAAPQPAVFRVPAGLESEYRQSVVLRPKGALIERITWPADGLNVSLREDVPGEVYLLTISARPGWNEGRGEPAVEVYLQDQNQPMRIPIREQHRAKPVSEEWNQAARALVGQPAPSFSATTLDGKSVAFDNAGGQHHAGETLGPEHTGGAPVPHPATAWTQGLHHTATGRIPAPQQDTGRIPVLRGVRAVIFWAPWCEHCVDHLKDFQALSEQYCDKGVDFLTIAARGGPPNGARDVLTRLGINVPTVLDRGSQIAGRFRLTAYPGIFLIGPSGRIEAAHVRSSLTLGQTGLENVRDDLRTELDLLLAGKTHEDMPGRGQGTWRIERRSVRGPTTRPAGPIAWAEAGRQTKKGRNHPLGQPVYIRNDGTQPLKVAKVMPADGIEILSGPIPDLMPGELAVLRYRATLEVPVGAELMRIETNDPRGELLRVRSKRTANPVFNPWFHSATMRATNDGGSHGDGQTARSKQGSVLAADGSAAAG